MNNIDDLQNEIEANYLNFFCNNLSYAAAKLDNRRILYLLICPLPLIIVSYLAYYVYQLFIKNPTWDFFEYGTIIFIVGIVLFSSAFIIPYALMQNYLYDIKKYIFPQLLKNIGEFETCPNSQDGIIPYLSKLFCFYSGFDTCSIDDYIKGTFNNININILELHLYRNNSHSASTTEFKGVFCIIPLKKDFPYRIIIKKPGLKLLPNPNEKMIYVKIANEEFDNNYDLYSNHPDHLNEILNGKLINCLNNLAKKGFKNKIMLSFEYNNLHIGISSLTKNWFDVSIFKSLRNPNTLKIVYEDFFKTLYIAELIHNSYG